MEQNNKINWKTVLISSGAYTSYIIGSGFASGQEVLQFFGSWGGIWPLIVPVITAVIIIVYCVSAYSSGSELQFENPSDAYRYYCGRYAAKFMDIFSMIMIAGIGIVMFAGSGAAINQYLGLPVYVGAIFLGVVSVVVVWLGLEKVTQVLGVAGIVIIAFILFTAIFTAFKTGFHMSEAHRNIPEYVAQGSVLQAGLFGVYDPIISGIFYGGNTLLTSFPFVVALGKNVKNKKEAVACGVGSSLLLILGVYFVLYIVLQNIDHIAAASAQIPVLTAISNTIPSLTLLFTLVIVCGIFTTITGYLWLIGRRFAKDGTAKQRIIVSITALVGIFTGSVLPFSTLINVLYPFAGCVGVVLLICIIVNDLRRRSAGGSRSIQGEGQSSAV